MRLLTKLLSLFFLICSIAIFAQSNTQRYIDLYLKNQITDEELSILIKSDTLTITQFAVSASNPALLEFSTSQYSTNGLNVAVWPYIKDFFSWATDKIFFKEKDCKKVFVDCAEMYKNFKELEAKIGK